MSILCPYNPICGKSSALETFWPFKHSTRATRAGTKMPNAVHELHEITRELYRLKALILELILEPKFELEIIVATLDDLDTEIARTKTLADALGTGGLITSAEVEARVAALKAINDGLAAQEVPAGAVTVTPATFPAVTAGQALSGAFAASDGSTGGTFAINSGAFFSGVTFNATGTYGGTVADATGATVAFGVTVTSAAGVVSTPTEYSVVVG